MDLVVGATGLLGTEVCRLLRMRGEQVRALVRKSSEPAKIEALSRLGVELQDGDLKDLPSLRAACAGVHSVITTATATLSRAEGDSIDTVDAQGTLDLIAAASAAGVQHFVFTSLVPIDMHVPLQNAKRAAERALADGSMPWTVLQPGHFFEVWFSPGLGFDLAAGTAKIHGAGQRALQWISYKDVARVAAAVIERGPHRRVLQFGGPEALSQREVIALVERTTRRKLQLEEGSDAALRDAYEAAKDPLEKTFAAFMLTCSTGDPQRLDNDCVRGLLDQPLSSIQHMVDSAVTTQ